jgi:hypothetical protein
MSSSRFLDVLAASALAALILFAAGCFQTSTSSTEISAQSQFRENARRLIAQLEPEMSLDDVKALWLDQVYPWKSETQIVGYGTATDTIIIQWYYTDLVKNDGRVTDNELTPVVFEKDGDLLGWGRDFLSQLYEYFEKQRKAQGG